MSVLEEYLFYFRKFLKARYFLFEDSLLILWFSISSPGKTTLLLSLMWSELLSSKLSSDAYFPFELLTLELYYCCSMLGKNPLLNCYWLAFDEESLNSLWKELWMSFLYLTGLREPFSNSSFKSRARPHCERLNLLSRLVVNGSISPKRELSLSSLFGISFLLICLLRVVLSDLKL